MEYIEVKRNDTSMQNLEPKNEVTVQNGNNGFRKRADFFREYLKTEKNDVVIGGYTPSVEDSNTLKGKLVQNTVVRHLNETGFEDKCVNVPLCIGLVAIDNVVWSYSSFQEVEGVGNLEFQLRVSLFDLAYHQFFGRQWAGQYEGLQGVGGASKPKLRLSQNIYFHTNIVSSNIVAVVELVASGLDENSRLKKVSCGWGVIRPFKQEGLPDTSRGVKQPIQKCQLYYGSPRALFFIDEPFEECQYLRPIPECQLGYTIATHKAMYTVQHLLPQNTVVGHNDVIPGLFDSDSSVKDKLKKPKALKSVACTIEQATLQLNPTIEKFEQELCETLHEDRLNMANKANDGTSVVIVERRLLVGVHNGWTFVEKPQTFLLDSRNISTNSNKPSASPMFLRSQRFKSVNKVLGEGDPVSENFLILNQKIHVQNILEDPMFAVVFILEYIVGEQLSAEDRKLSQSLHRGNTRSFTLRWAAWNPFLQPNTPHVTVGLIGGPTPSPDREFMYKVPDTAMQDVVSSRTAGGLLAFQWGFGFKDSSSSGTHPTHPLSLMPGFPQQMGSAHSMRSGVTEASDMMIESPSQKPPTGRPGQMSHRSPPGPMSLSVPQQQAGGVLQPMPMVPMQYPIYPQASLQQSYIPYHQGPVPQYGLPYGGEIQEMQQHVPAHQPILTSAPVPRKGSGLSRAAYAKLYSVGFPPVLDRNGEPPEVIDPNTHVVTVDLQRELNDPLQCNEVIFQFLAYSRMSDPSGASSEPGKTAGTVFLSFQFYRNQQVTTERLLLSKAQNDWSSDASVMPYILSRLDKDGTLLKGPPGLEVRYFMDPAFMKPGETPMFLQHVSQQTMFIDVWDGDSLLPLGSAEVDLKYLCRCGMEAVQTTFELDVYSTEYQEDPSLNPEGGAGGVKPANMFYTPRGKLHLRMANIGHPVDPKATSAVYISLPPKSMQVVSATASNSAFGGGSLVAGESKTEHGLATKKRVARAHHMAESNREVAVMLFSKQAEIEPITESHREADSERQRKLARMAAIRNKEGGIEKPQTLMAHKQLKTERTRDLKTLEIYRLQTKKDGIQAMLSQSISTEHTIHPSFGASEFFEFVLRNPFNVEHYVKIEWEDKSLQCVTDAREWRYFKQLYQIQSQIEEGMFNKEAKSHSPEVFLRPKETVNIPFKYLMFKADQSVNPQGPVDPFRHEPKTKARMNDNFKPRTVKVFFKSEDEKPLAILLLKVEPQPHVINKTFRFHSPEQTFLKKSIRLPPLDTLPGAPVGSGNSVKAFVRCSDPNIICDTKTTQPGEPQDIFIKVPVGASPQIKRFFMSVYLDPFLARPVQIWQFYVHALQRVDVSAVEGQTSRFSLILKGTQASRLVQCYSSHPQEMSLYPSEQVMLAAGATHELNVAIRPMLEGFKYFYINVVDVEFHQLVRTWLICVNSRAPMISRAFELVLPVGGGKGCSKKITYTNPYPHRKTFVLRCNREDLLQFKDNTLDIEGQGTATIGLRFSPVMRAGPAEILVFINDEDDKNEETFKVSALYQRV